MDGNEFDSIEGFFSDPAFQLILKNVTVSTITWDDFLDSPMPRGLPANRTWKLIHEVNFNAGTVLPDFLPDAKIFYRYSSTIISTLIQLIRKYQETSSLEAKLWSSFTTQGIWARTRDVIAAARIEGVDVEESRVLAIWDPVEKRVLSAPSNSAEQLVVNALEAECNVKYYAKRDFNGELILSIAKDLMRDVRLEDLQNHSIRNSLDYLMPQNQESSTEQVGGEHSETSDDRRELTDLIASYLDGSTAVDTDLDLVRALLAPDLVRTFVPIGPASSLLGMMVQKVVFSQQGFQLLNWLPLTYAREKWENGTGVLETDFSAEDVSHTLKHEREIGLYDITPIQTVNLQIALQMLDRFTRFVTKIESYSNSIKEKLMNSSIFNQRQCAVLARASKGSDRTFTIRHHQQNHGISYATARRDFLELKDSGYLQSRFDGNTQVFYASDDFDAKIARVLGDSDSVREEIPEIYLPPR
ncbi:MAG: hypothetical protein ACOYIK_06280 [Coriobacteriales bacterium]|jgi:hypothetical protein